MFQFRGFPSYGYVFTIWCITVNYADCSIRKSAHHSLLTAPRSLSQLTTSFFGSQCQGILHTLLLALPFVSERIFVFVEFFYLTIKKTCFFNCRSSSRSFKYFSFLFSFQDAWLYSLRIHIKRHLCLLISILKQWAQMDSNHRPHAYQACALTTWAMRPIL